MLRFIISSVDGLNALMQNFIFVDKLISNIFAFILPFYRSPCLTTLGYEVNVIPRFNFPAIFLERIIRSDLPVNLQALACRSESNFEGNQNILSQNTPSLQSLTLGSVETEIATPVTDKVTGGDVKEKYVKATFGPLSPATGELNSNWGIFGKSCPLDKPCMVDEVHLRRFDGLLVIHLTLPCFSLDVIFCFS